MSSAAVVHSSTLLGKELRETFERRPRAWDDVILLATLEEEIGSVTEVAGGAALVLPFETERLRGIPFAFFCGSMADTRPLLGAVPPGTVPILLATDALAADGIPVVAGVNSAVIVPGVPLLSPHPAVSLLALALFPLQRFGIAEVVATVILPASLLEVSGLDELFGQTRSIVALSSRPPSTVFGTQLAFNLLPASTAAEVITDQLRQVLVDLPRPRLELLQGSIFHAVSVSLFVRFTQKTPATAARKALTGHPYLEAASKPHHFGPIDAAASDKVLFAPPRQDGDDGVWIWAAMDNLTRGGALNALEIAEAIA